MEEEIWKDVKGYEGLYQISNFGRVKSLVYKGKIKELQTDKNGYARTSLWKKNNGSLKQVHRLVAIAFIPNPQNKSQVNHIDGNKKNNNVNNLEWVTPSENSIHAYRMGLRTVNKTGTGKYGKLNGSSKPVYMLDKETGEILIRFDSLADAGRYLGRKSNSMGGIAKQTRGETKTAYGFKWRYVDENKSK